MTMTKDLITPQNYLKVCRRLDELLVRCWKMSRPLFPRMSLEFKVYPQESYYSYPGHIGWITPYWRGDAFTVSILFHEGYHWNIYPVDLFRSIKEVFEARRLLAEELKFQPEIIMKSLWSTKEDWSKFPHPPEEFQFVENILGDYLINLHIHDNHPTIWDDLWNFLSVEGTFYLKDKPMKRDATFILYVAAYSELLPGVTLPFQLQEAKSLAKLPLIAKIVTECRAGRISTIYAVKELTKLFHENIMQDFKEGQEGGGQEDGKIECPQCHHDEWEIVGYEDQKTGKWIKL